MCFAVGSNVRETCVFVSIPTGYTNRYFVSIIFFSVPCTYYPCEAVAVLGFSCISLDLYSTEGNSADEFVVDDLD